MQNISIELVAIWSVAAVSLIVQIYLFLTWPRTEDSLPSGQRTLSSNGQAQFRQANAAAPASWEAPSDAALDGILAQSLPSASTNQRSLRQRRKKKTNEPITLQQRIIRAGIYRKGGIRTFHLTRIVTTVLALCSGFVIIPFTPLPWIVAIYIGAFAALVAYLSPSFWLDKRLRRRQTTMRRALPDALDLITVCLQGGLSLPASLSRVARELGPAHPMLATELSIVEREIQMGRNTGEAMLQFAQRFDLEELRSLSSVIGQTEKYGGTIAGALKTYAESLRVRRKQRAEEMAQKAAVKLLFPTIFCIFPGIFVVILGPTAVRMYEVMSNVTF